MTAREQIERLTLERKAALLQGKTVWTTYAFPEAGVESVFLSDGPHGLRKQVGSADHLGLGESVPATCFPTAATMANSWNTELAERLGDALGEEAAANGVQVVLGPGLNIKRTPLGGRSFEYFSEDPILSGRMAAAYIKGIQGRGVAACPKHFAVNSQETRRMSADSVLDERTLREIYLTGFEIAVREGGALAIMSAYNRVNGEYANENAHLLTEVLRDEWGFRGFVVTDWGADNNHTEGVRAGSNLVMPAPGADTAIGLCEDVRAGKIPESVLDERLTELLTVVNGLRERAKDAPTEFDTAAHHALARECAEESIVLLDNDGLLPLDKNKKIALIGDFAKAPRYQGAGSSQVNPTGLDSLYDGLLALGASNITYARGFDRTAREADEGLISEAVSAAESCEVVLLSIGLDEALESEGMDRTHIDLSPVQSELVRRVSEVNRNVVLVLSGGAPFIMPPRECYRAAIHGYLGGQAGGSAMARAILGLVNPSGKLNESWPESLSDTPCYNYFPSPERLAEYREGLYVGYRYYLTRGVPVRYPFGYGLSYTEFEYSDLSASAEELSFTLTNTGDVEGSEVAEVYVSLPKSGVYRPKRELKAFRKLRLAPGESRRVTIPLDEYAFRYYNSNAGRWETEEGDYEITVAKSSLDRGLSVTVHISGTAAADSAPECYRTADIRAVSDEDFAALLGRDIPDGKWGGEITENDCLCQLYYAKGAVGRLLYKFLKRKMDKAERRGDTDINILFIYNMPIRAIAKMTRGYVTRKMTEDILLIFNGHPWRGFGRLLCDFFRGLSARRKFEKAICPKGKKMPQGKNTPNA